MSQSPQSVLSEIPGWEDAVARELSGGQTNRTWLVVADHGKAVLKIDDDPRGAPYNSRQNEAQIQTIAAHKGLANPVIVATETVYMTHYLDGSVWTRRYLDDDQNLTRLGQTLRRLHALPLTGRVFDARQAAKDYARKIDNADPDLVDQHMQVIDKMRSPQNLCCCHNDLVVGNIIATPDIRFLDWEYACDNDPFFDLATVVAHHGLAANRADFLLDAYFDGDGVRWREQLAIYERYYTAILWLWRAARSSSPTVAQLPQL